MELVRRQVRFHSWAQDRSLMNPAAYASYPIQLEPGKEGKAFQVCGGTLKNFICLKGRSNFLCKIQEFKAW